MWTGFGNICLCDYQVSAMKLDRIVGCKSINIWPNFTEYLWCS